MPTLDRPKNRRCDPGTDQAEYANFAEYEEAKDAWNRQEAIREFQESSAKTAKNGQ